MIAEPPLDPGAVNVTVAWAIPAVAVPMVGAPGTVYGVTALDALEGFEVPPVLVAVTVKVYDVPLVRPVTVSGVPTPVAVYEPGLDVTV